MMRGRAGALVPQQITNAILLTFPWLYGTRFVMYESYLSGCIPLLKECISKTERVRGDILELGCARAGTTSILAMYLQSVESKRKIYALDSFGDGFDPCDLQQEPLSPEEILARKKAFHYNSFDYVMKKVRILGLQDRIVLVKGFFSHTLPLITDPLSLVVIDCDLGTTVDFCLRGTFPHLSSGGLVVIDDYNNPDWRGVTPVVDRFIHANQSELTIVSKGHPFIFRRNDPQSS
jgi:Macrocin-O-methyltransferase (TylF)